VISEFIPPLVSDIENMINIKVSGGYNWFDAIVPD